MRSRGQIGGDSMIIKNSVCLVTGSAIRVGKAIALNLARKGAMVAIHYNSHLKEAKMVEAEINKLGSETIIVRGDISQKKDWQIMSEQILEKWGRIDVLVNNAAVFYRTPFFKVTDQEWNQFMDINLKGVFYGCQVIGNIMFENRKGKIINIADVSAKSVWPNYIPYCVSKVGVIALTKGLAKTLGPHVTVNTISPGTVLLAEEFNEVEEKILIEKTPLKRVGNPEDIANTVAFLIEGSDFITGADFHVDGGRSLT